jgi:ubiquinone/menaquinone biosynthesis C-methylase UbiE
MFFDKFMAKQLGCPSGIFSSLTALILNRTNSDINKATVELMDIKSNDRVLEIGFGGGTAMEQMARLIENGLVAGIDISDSMVKRGQNKFAKSISQGKVQIKKGDASRIPYERGYFDKACTVNTIFFWSEPVTCLKEIHRILKPRGLIVLSVDAKEEIEELPVTRYGFALYSDNELRNFLNEAGFLNIRVERRRGQQSTSVLLVATKR